MFKIWEIFAFIMSSASILCLDTVSDNKFTGFIKVITITIHKDYWRLYTMFNMPYQVLSNIYWMRMCTNI